MVEVSNNFIQECEANVGTYKFGKIKVNYIDDNPFNYEQGAYSSSNGAKIDAEQSIRYNKLVECEPNFKYKIELGNSAYKMKIVTYNANQAFIAAHDNLAEGSELTTESTAAYISVTIYSNDTLEGTNITLNNTIRNGEISGAELKGNTLQDGTPTPSSPVPVNNVTGEQVVRVCGKNILPQDKYINNTTINGITYTNNGDGTFSASGTATANTSINIIPIGEIELEANQPYYLYSSIPYNANTFNLSIVMAENNATKYLTANNTYTPTTTPTQERLALWIPNGVSVNIQNAKIMLVKGSTKPTEYEKLQNKDYEINLGKNLYEGSQDFSGTWANSTSWSTAEETYNGLAVKYKKSVWMGLYKEIEVQKGDVYTFSFFAKKETSGRVTAYLKGSGVGATPENKGFDLTTEWQRFSFTFTITKSGKLRARVENPTNDSITYICGYQLEKNDVVTSYSPYFTPIELNKIGNYQDFIRKGTGKNLFDKNNANILNGWLDNNKMALSPTQLNRLFYIPCKANTTYTISRSILTSTFRVATYDSEPFPTIDSSEAQYDISGLIKDNSATSITITTGANAKYLIVHYGRLETDLNIEESLKTIQIEENSQATSYEPYACTGKNLFDKNTQLYESNRYIDGSGQVGTSTEWSIFKTNLEPNTTYTLTNSGASGLPGYVLYNSSGVRVGGSNYSTKKYITFTTTSDTSYMLESVVTDTSSTRYDLDIFQIEQGSIATSYEPYFYSTLRDKWYIEKNVGKVVLDGSRNWTKSGNTNIDRFVLSGYVDYGDTNCFSNYFNNGIYSDTNYTKNQIFLNTYSSTKRIIINYSTVGTTTLAQFKTWLSAHNTSVYYVLNTPTYTLIENEELIEQLNALSHAETQEGTTNITSSGILPAILDVTPNLIESIRGKQTTPIVGYNITGDDDLINFKITSKADSNGNILGATSQSQVDIEIFNENNAHNLENKQVYISTGLNEIEGNYCKWQPFTITQTKDTQTKNHTTYTGYDDMMRGNEAYIDNVDYGEEGVTLYDFTCKLAKEMGMALGNITMTNGDFIVKGNNFTNNEAKLVVLKNVAQMAGGFAMIDRDNLLRIVELSPEDAMTPIELTTNLYTEDFQNSAKFGEINEFAIGETNIETNAIVRSDDASIAKNGVKKIEILDNMFLGLLEDKEIAIEPLWDAFNGFSYYPFKTPYNGYPYIDLGDKINITDINSNVYSTLVLNNVFEYNGGYKGNIGAEALSITAAKYKTNNTLSKQFRKVGIDIDRVEGKITSEIDAATDGITKAYNTAINQTAKNIGLSVTAINNTISGNPEVEGDTGLAGLVQTINSSYLTVDSDGFKAVSSTATAAQEKADKVEENTQKIVSQLQFDAVTGLTISAEGSTDDDMKLNLTNSQVNFMYRNSPVLVINGNKIEFTGATFQKFDLGNYVWQAEDDDSLSLIYEGD